MIIMASHLCFSVLDTGQSNFSALRARVEDLLEKGTQPREEREQCPGRTDKI